MAKFSMEEARVCIKSPCKELINEEVEVCIDGIMFHIILREDSSLLRDDDVKRKSLDDDIVSEADLEEEELDSETEVGGGGETEYGEEGSTCQHQMERERSGFKKVYKDMTYHNQHSFNLKENENNIGQKVLFDPITKGIVLEVSPGHALNAPLAFDESKEDTVLEEADGHEVATVKLGTAGTILLSKEMALDFTNDEYSRTNFINYVELDGSGSGVSMGQKEKALLFFDRACSYIKSPKRSKKRSFFIWGRR